MNVFACGTMQMAMRAVGEAGLLPPPYAQMYEQAQQAMKRQQQQQQQQQGGAPFSAFPQQQVRFLMVCVGSVLCAAEKW